MRKFKSTRGNKMELTGAQAIIKGLSDDKGLFVPTELPKLPFTIDEMIGKSYQEIGQFLGKEPKSIDNALQRIKHKIQKYVEKYPK